MNINHIDLTPYRTGQSLPLSTGQIDTKWQKIQTSINEIVDKVNANTEAFEEITRVDLLVLMSNGDVVPGKQYMIIDAQASNVGCLASKVLVTGIATNSVSVSGSRFMLVPDYENVIIWFTELPTPTVGDKVIYGARVWVNLNGNAGGVSADPSLRTFELDSEWEQVDYEEGDDYSVRAFDCKYDIENDLIVEQRNIGVVCYSSKITYDFIGGNLLDRCDWNQDKITYFSDVRLMCFLNNSDLKQCAGVSTQLLTNNECQFIVDVSTYVDKLKYQTSDLSCIKDNKCKGIGNIKGGNSIIGIPETVEAYAFVTDDETGYIEFDFDEEPKDAGTYVVGCISPKNVSLTKVEANCDGNLTPSISINFGIDVDDPNYTSFASDDVNSSVQINASGGNRTTAYNRLIKIEFSDRIESGKLWIAYKYV